ncbi:tRNA (guanine(37)-N1)-methyltransferase, putative (macronuclear) [Tetrahymena thermophila SB210]|uniref:tRNA (Guanine(37)-N1)-methyltransferase, putative n=1 Tax=Tetrahymena thermophila (strain SB210) TaxID=312017 RepID=I7MA21_TETTS|nr:tRNA (guanine(37)-N1)-methyltransferase, putative [Tetrahymena thermophila SB210]EAS03242.3 tRNA (guanine(37)-N1)-methyltransferase, putative [Tetrahymena thermophila SB210]|eukprot:XP_001023487.3 tRNA (guanine(37)-N1)-methyltransferase, putative [Tetrahymena thermophila SB210]
MASLFKAAIRSQLSKLSNMFNEESETIALKIPMTRCNEFLVKLHDFVIQEQGVPTITKEDNKMDFQNRLILLNKEVDQNLSQIPSELKTWIQEQNVEIIKHKIQKDISTFSLEEAIEKVINNKDIDSHIKLETLKQFKIIEFNENQKPFKDQIASIVLDKSQSSITTILQKKIDQDDEHFFVNSYEYVLGEKNFILDLQEGSCKFLIDISKFYINNYFQEERDRILNLINDQESVVDLFGDIILDTRLYKERNAKVLTCVTSATLQEFFQDIKKQNSLSHRSASRSLSKAVNEGTQQTPKGLYEIECKNVFNFLEDHFKQKEHSNVFIISRILKDLSFLGSFVGILGKNHQQTENGNGSTEDRPINLFFYYLVNQEEYDNKPLSELIVDNLNQKIIDISSSQINQALFEKSDLGSVTQINFDLPNKILIGVNIKIRSEILNNPVVLIAQVKESYNKSIHSPKIQHDAQDISEYEGDLQKKIKA